MSYQELFRQENDSPHDLIYEENFASSSFSSVLATKTSTILLK